MLEIMLASILKKLNEPGLEINPEVFQKLIAADGAASDNFGYSVATSGDGSTVIVGAFGDDDKGSYSGSSYVFTKQSNGSYLETQKLLASDGTANDYFGRSVAISGDGLTIVIGAPYDDVKGTDSGSVYIFTKQPNGSYLEIQKLVPADGSTYDYFGYSVVASSDGSTIIVGAYLDSDKGTYSGSVYIFTKQANGTYLQTQKLVAADGASGDYFGNSVAISGNGSTVVVGTPNNDDKGRESGSVYIFTKQANGSYLETQKLLASDGVTYDYFGNSVAISGDGSTIIVGTYGGVDDKGIRSGSAYIFSKQANSSYLETQKLLASDGIAGDWIGVPVTISEDGSTIILGAHGNDYKSYDSGAAYVFTKQVNGSYLQTQKLVASDGVGRDYFGYSVAVSQTSVVIGAYNHLSKGAVYVY